MLTFASGQQSQIFLMKRYFHSFLEISCPDTKYVFNMHPSRLGHLYFSYAWERWEELCYIYRNGDRVLGGGSLRSWRFCRGARARARIPRYSERGMSRRVSLAGSPLARARAHSLTKPPATQAKEGFYG